jgi:predicted nucleic acid-binding protein
VDRLREVDEIILTPVVPGGLRAGFMGGPRRVQNEGQLEEFMSPDRVFVYPLDDDTAERFAAIHDGLRRARTPVPTNDLWIAASAMQHGLSVVTTDAHFTRIPRILAEHFA